MQHCVVLVTYELAGLSQRGAVEGGTGARQFGCERGTERNLLLAAGDHAAHCFVFKY